MRRPAIRQLGEQGNDLRGVDCLGDVVESLRRAVASGGIVRNHIARDARIFEGNLEEKHVDRVVLWQSASNRSTTC